MIEFNAPTILVLVVTFVALLACVSGFGKLLLHLYDVRAGERHAQLELALQREASRIAEVQRRIDALSNALPLEYVRREDWIRFSQSIDAKLDRLAVLILQNRGSQ